MQPRLTRSRTEVMVAGVCGGLGDYFGVDPTIVRFIFVIVMLTSGLSLPVYLILWLVMPRAQVPTAGDQPFQDRQHFGADASQFGQHVAQLGQHISQEAAQFGQQISREIREVLVSQPRSQQQSRSAGSPPMPTAQPPDPSMYNFDPITGQPVRPQTPSTGQTINLGSDPNIVKGQYSQQTVVPPAPQMAPRRQRRNWSMLGLILVGIGGLILINQVFGSLDFVFPLVLIVAGIVMLRRR